MNTGGFFFIKNWLTGSFLFVEFQTSDMVGVLRGNVGIESTHPTNSMVNTFYKIDF